MSKPDTNAPTWHRFGSVIGMAACLAAIAYSLYRWFDALVYPVIGEHLNEIALHTPDNVSAGDLAIFAVSLVLVNALRYKFDADLRRRRLANLRRGLGSIRRMLRTSAP